MMTYEVPTETVGDLDQSVFIVIYPNVLLAKLILRFDLVIILECKAVIIRVHLIIFQLICDVSSECLAMFCGQNHQ